MLAHVYSTRSEHWWWEFGSACSRSLALAPPAQQNTLLFQLRTLQLFPRLQRARFRRQRVRATLRHCRWTCPSHCATSPRLRLHRRPSMWRARGRHRLRLLLSEPAARRKKRSANRSQTRQRRCLQRRLQRRLMTVLTKAVVDRRRPTRPDNGERRSYRPGSPSSLPQCERSREAPGVNKINPS